MMGSRCGLAGLGMVNALGRTLGEIWPRLIAGDQTRFSVREDLIPGVARPFGMVQGELPEIPPDLARHACRNNQLALAALAQIRADVDSAVSRFGAERVGVVARIARSIVPSDN